MAEHVYDSSDSCTGKSAVQEPLEYSIYGLLKKYQITITTAESATGGMIASTLINVPGISEFFTEGYVTYSNEAKVKMTGVAGPDGGTKECPVGLVFIGCYLNGKTVTERHMFSGSRMDVRKSATESALSLLKKCIEETYAV